MRYTDSQLREIAQGRRLPLETKLFGATVLALVVLNLLFQWNSERLAIVFFGLGTINYFAHRMNAISHFVLDGNRFNENAEKVEVDA